MRFQVKTQLNKKDTSTNLMEQYSFNFNVEGSSEKGRKIEGINVIKSLIICNSDKLQVNFMKLA
jgi:hypothetical protein